MATASTSLPQPSPLRAILAQGVAIPAAILAMLSMVVLPLPPLVLDVLFTFNIALSVMVLIAVFSVRKPLDFAIFPTVLLMTTIFRLALNVASTRVVLLDGHTGTAAAGHVIESFGKFVIGGNYAVGIVVFIILTIINFVVITKGSGRVSEVTARFTLDAMPGKQMAIDADLNAGIIDKETANKRREELSQEADFFGSMDGASKFVSGDAIAGLLILLINIIGGLAIGIIQHDLSPAEAGRIYTLLTIGDGLAAQIPALFLSMATAIIVTRVTTSETMTEQAVSQLNNPNALFVAAGIVFLLGLVPGMPHLVFFALATCTAGVGWMTLRNRVQDESTAAEAAKPLIDAPKELDWSDLDQVDLIGLEIGYGLLPLVNAETGGQLMQRVKGVRKKLSAELGFLVQPVRIRDALSLEPDSYQIVLNGVVRGRAEVKVGKELAINPGRVYGQVEGEATKEPAFGLEAVWIDPAQREYARSMGYTVVDPATAIATHLNKVLRENAADLLSHDEVQQLLDKLAARAPKLVEDLTPAKLSLGVITRTLQQLLTESVSIRDMRSIAEALTDASSRTQDPEQLAAQVRPKIGRMIMQALIDPQDTLLAMTLDPALEQMLHNVSQHSQPGQGLMLEPGLADRLFRALRDGARTVEEQGHPAVLVVSPGVRPWLARMVRHRITDLTVLSYSEIPEDQAVKVIHTVTAEVQA